MSTEGVLQGTPTQFGLQMLYLVLSDMNQTWVTVPIEILVSDLVFNSPPVAVNDTFLVGTIAPLVVPAPGVLANDSDPDNNPLTAELMVPPAMGTISWTGNGGFQYSLPSHATGTLSFTYRIHDGRGGYATGLVSLVVVSNWAPVAVDDDYSVLPGGTLTVSAPGVLANDTDPENQPLTCAIVSTPLHGDVTLNANGSFIYVPMPGFVGEDEFVYQAVDTQGLTDEAFVRIFVHPALLAGEQFLSLRFETNPVRAGENAVLVARVRDPLSSGPATNNTVGVSALPPGATTPVPLSLSRFTSPMVAEFSMSLSTSGLAHGLSEFVVSATNSAPGTVSKPVSLLVFSGVRRWVGDGQTHASIASALAAASDFDALILRPQAFPAAQNTSLVMNKKVVIAGERGLHFTSLTPGTGMFASMTVPDVFVAGLTIQGGSSGTAVLSAKSTVYQCRIRDNIHYSTNTVHLGTSGLAITAADVRVTECWFRNNKMLQAPASSTFVQGSAIQVFGVDSRIDRCFFWECDAIIESWCHGGAVCVTAKSPSAGITGIQTGIPMAGTAVIDTCLFASCRAISTVWSFGGGLCLMDGGVADVSRSQFVSCHALTGTYAPPGMFDTVSTGGRAYGGGICAVYGSILRLAKCRFDGCSAKAPTSADGGAIDTHIECFSSVRDCLIENCSLQSNTCRGGGVCVADYSAMRIEGTVISQCQAGLPGSTRLGGGVCVAHLSGLELFDCRIVGCNSSCGGGVTVNHNSWMVADQCILQANTTTSAGHNAYPLGGAGLYVRGESTVSVQHCRFEGNQAQNGGGGAVHILFGSSSYSGSDTNSNNMIRLGNCLFAGNSSTNGTGGVSMANPGLGVVTVQVFQCTFATNTGTTGGAISGSGSWSATNCVFFGNSPVSNAGFSLISSTTTNPQFAAGLLGTHYLSPLSPALDIGTAPPAWLDISGLTTSVLEIPDTGVTDAGYHYPVSSAPRVPRVSETVLAMSGTYFSAGNGLYPLPRSTPPMLIVP